MPKTEIEAEPKVILLPSIAIEPSLVADKDERDPRSAPIGVRATPTMHTSVQKKKKKSRIG